MLSNKAQSTTQLAVGTPDTSISFIQQEHAKTLKELHSEIQKLQQKCSRLTFELTMSAGNKATTSVYAEDDMSLEKELQRNQEKVSFLQSQLVLQREKTALLEQEMCEMRKEIDELCKEKQDIIVSAQQQLDHKSNTITQLVNRLHHNQYLLQKLQQNREATLSTTPQPFCPPLPKEPPPTSDVYRTGRITRRLRRTVTSPHPSIRELNTPPSNERHDSLPEIHSTGTTMPLNIEKPKDVVIHHTNALPPIYSSDETSNDSLPLLRGARAYRKHHGVINKGLNSAPCSMRLMNYATSNVSHIIEKDCKEDGQLLMVKQQETMLYKLSQSHRK